MKIVCAGIFMWKTFIFSIFSYLFFFIWSFLTYLCCRREKNAVQLDDEGGRTFLRVLIHLIMHDYPPLLSGALHLLFKHFSQRAEVLQAFKQVWTGRASLQDADCRGSLRSLLTCLAQKCPYFFRGSDSAETFFISWPCVPVHLTVVHPEAVTSGIASISENIR